MAKFLYFFFRFELIVDAFANKRRRRVERTATLGTDTSPGSTLHSRRFACMGEILRQKKKVHSSLFYSERVMLEANIIENRLEE